MGIVINHNMPAVFAANMLDRSYSRLAVNTQRLSTGLRINSSADDPAGFGIREVMRSDLANMEQGLRNAADGVSLLQTAEGALAVIDEKLLRMKELAEQAATGTYTTLQREIINSEYQAMAAEIDRIASATQFNGVKLLDGSANLQHHGQGLKIHFGAGNSQEEDYYFVKIGDVRATVSTGLRIGGDAKNDIWSTTPFMAGLGPEGCCGGGIASLSQSVSGWTAGQIFSYGYNWDNQETVDTSLSQGRYVAGAYQLNGPTSLSQLVNEVNKGTQSRVRLDIRNNASSAYLVGDDAANNATRICLDNEIYYLGSYTMTACACTGSASAYEFININNHGSAEAELLTGVYGNIAVPLVRAINSSSQQFWAKLEENQYRSGYTTVYIFNKEGGNHDDIFGSDQHLGPKVAGAAGYQSAILWYNDETEAVGTDGSYFGNGGELWGTLRAQPTAYGTWAVRLDGRDVGDERDLWILNAGRSSIIPSAYDLDFFYTGGAGFGYYANASGESWLPGLNRETFTEIQNASDGDWLGACLRTQSGAQEALEAVSQAISKKDKIRASLGAYMNRLENTISNLEIMHETLQGAESRISDVDIATEMTDFVRNQILSQTAVSILSQANALPEMALSLLNG
ncbi:MAG: flagellin [Deltaproteobacteria bacterium]|jgi:flagellin|nr:flagellin [Deltaproteobacteria bacterium]